MLFCRLLIFSKSTFLKNSFRNTFRVSNSLDPDLARHVGPDLGPSCLQRLSADDTSVGKEFRTILDLVLLNHLISECMMNDNLVHDDNRHLVKNGLLYKKK